MNVKIKYLKNKSIYAAIGIIFLIIFAMASMRFFSGEDDWICSGGQWIRHGNPSFPAPSTPCGKKEYTMGQIIPWEEAITIIQNCEAKSLGQTHALKISITLKNNIRIMTQEPVIDEIFTVYGAVAEKCGQIPMSTE